MHYQFAFIYAPGKVMNFMIFRHHNKYTHPVLYMYSQYHNWGKVKLKHVTNKLYTDLSSKWEATLGKRQKILKPIFLIVIFFF